MINVIIPSTLNVDGELVKNKQLSISEDHISFTAWVQLQENGSTEILDQVAYSYDVMNTSKAQPAQVIYNSIVNDVAEKVNKLKSNRQKCLNVQNNLLVDFEADVLALIST